MGKFGWRFYIFFIIQPDPHLLNFFFYRKAQFLCNSSSHYMQHQGSSPSSTSSSLSLAINPQLSQNQQQLSDSFNYSSPTSLTPYHQNECVGTIPSSSSAQHNYLQQSRMNQFTNSKPYFQMPQQQHMKFKDADFYSPDP